MWRENLNNQIVKQTQNINEDLNNSLEYKVFVKGLGIENSFEPSVSDYRFFFKTESEKIYVWTHTKNKNSSLVSEVNLIIKDKFIWKTVGSLINLSLAYKEAFEAVDYENSIEYKIMLNFNQTLSIENIRFFKVDRSM